MRSACCGNARDALACDVADEEIVLATERDSPQRAFGRVVVERRGRIVRTTALAALRRSARGYLSPRSLRMWRAAPAMRARARPADETFNSIARAMENITGVLARSLGDLADHAAGTSTTSYGSAGRS